MVADILTGVLVLLGVAGFFAGSVGLLRFPDTHSRLHALTKADNLGLGLIALGLAFQAEGVADILKLALIWALAILAAGTAAQLVARSALEDGASGEEDAP
ncbi:monovalent cation/H(+) antiporter subunit G [Roseococcus microcysteis]|uniref:monovalent cation/H(+) antiporter subunit G n=1 Tax=Roseococcus microcysteis TaxID=2771361 RepID=UPI00168A608D|nr:monovalent cation/H(+) antiporter subunit G [Roseococcus microcysteis]